MQTPTTPYVIPPERRYVPGAAARPGELGRPVGGFQPEAGYENKCRACGWSSASSRDLTRHKMEMGHTLAHVRLRGVHWQPVA